MNSFRVAIYDSFEDMQHGHSVGSRTFDAVDSAIQHAKSSIGGLRDYASISCKDHDKFPGAILELDLDFNNRQDQFSIEDFWMYPDPNYRGEEYPSSKFHGTVGDFLKQQKEESLEEIER